MAIHIIFLIIFLKGFYSCQQCFINWADKVVECAAIELRVTGDVCLQLRLHNLAGGLNLTPPPIIIEGEDDD